jgi:hypothetical protein
MELNFLGFLARVSVHVLHFDDLWHVLDDLYDTVQLIDFNDINKLLLEELGESTIHLCQDLRVFKRQFLHLASQ